MKSLAIQWERWVTERYTERRSKRERRKEGEELAGRCHGFEFLAEIIDCKG